jgi:hypothetical protein
MSEFQHDKPTDVGDLAMYCESGYWYVYRMQGCGHVEAISMLVFPATEEDASPVAEVVLPFRPKCLGCQMIQS